ncbi:MAG: hypothetical protein HZT41_09165 [Dechloromonas sp.]|nr:MAG: hypothetical protein HZT41_09165 [Dechloromonas sp.]
MFDELSAAQRDRSTFPARLSGRRQHRRMTDRHAIKDHQRPFAVDEV